MMDIPGMLKQVVDASSQLNGWALLLGGGAVAMMVGTSYHRPVKLLWRLQYLLFLPGWVFLGCSLSQGNNIVGKYLASLVVRKEQFQEIADQVNNLYALQWCYLLWSLACFGCWLAIYTVYWIFFWSSDAGGE